MFFKSDRPVCNHLNVNFIKKKKTTPLHVCPFKCTYIGKNHFSFISVWSEIMSLKSDRLELGFSIHIFIGCALLKCSKSLYMDRVNISMLEPFGEVVAISSLHLSSRIQLIQMLSVGIGQKVHRKQRNSVYELKCTKYASWQTCFMVFVYRPCSESDCTSRVRELDPGPVPYFCGDWSWYNFYGRSHPSAD